MDGTYSNGNPRRVCVSSRFVIHGGTAWKSFEGCMGPNPKGTDVTSASCHVLPYMCVPHYEYARQGYTPFKRRVSEIGR
jgi:hypothetical protein